MEFECTAIAVDTLPTGRLHVVLTDAQPANEVWDKAECARRLRVTVRTIDKYMKLPLRPIPYSKISGRVRFTRNEVESWLAKDDLNRKVESFRGLT